MQTLWHALHRVLFARHKDEAASRSRPRVEQLEDRILATSTPAPDPFLFTHIPETAPLALHIHPNLTILINGRQRVVPAGIGIFPDGNYPLHTHDATGKIHIESTRLRTFTLQDFFTVWGATLSPQQIFKRRVDATHVLRMTVNGRPSKAFGALVLRDLQQIVIRYVTLPRPM
jgi:hypothetical protein